MPIPDCVYSTIEKTARRHKIPDVLVAPCWFLCFRSGRAYTVGLWFCIYSRLFLSVCHILF